MFTNKEKALIDRAYFKIVGSGGIHRDKSKNTRHCWIIQKRLSQGKRMIYLYHKHSDKDEYYHQHNRTSTVGQAIHDIKDHDRYVLRYVD